MPPTTGEGMPKVDGTCGFVFARGKNEWSDWWCEVCTDGVVIERNESGGCSTLGRINWDDVRMSEKGLQGEWSDRSYRRWAEKVRKHCDLHSIPSVCLHGHPPSDEEVWQEALRLAGFAPSTVRDEVTLAICRDRLKELGTAAAKNMLCAWCIRVGRKTSC